MIYVALFLAGLAIGVLAGFELHHRLVMGAGRYKELIKNGD